MNATLRAYVRERAEKRCEYCRLREQFVPFSFQIEHIVAKKHGGDDEPDNLAWACSRCNLHKGTDLTTIDPETQALVPLFNPRSQSWSDHFWLDGVEIKGLTDVGRATVQLLNMNAPKRLRLRAALRRRGELDMD